MDEKNKNSLNILSYSLDASGALALDKLIKWTKFVGIANIGIGCLYCLTIFVFSLPTVIIGIITIAMGMKLTVAANHLKFAMANNESESLSFALDQLRQYFTINGILLIVTIVFIGVLIILATLFAGFFIELLNESGFDYSIIAINNINNLTAT